MFVKVCMKRIRETILLGKESIQAIVIVLEEGFMKIRQFFIMGKSIKFLNQHLVHVY